MSRCVDIEVCTILPRHLYWVWPWLILCYKTKNETAIIFGPWFSFYYSNGQGHKGHRSYNSHHYYIMSCLYLKNIIKKINWNDYHKINHCVIQNVVLLLEYTQQRPLNLKRLHHRNEQKEKENLEKQPEWTDRK